MAITSLTQLVNNIQGSINNLLGKSSDLYPKHPQDDFIKKVTAEIDKENWNKLSFPYTFSVVSTKQNGSGAENYFSDFPLPLAPQAIRQSERPAISIKPTQGGTSVSHSGNGYKTLNLKGTTGLAPFRGAGGVNSRTGEAIFQPKELKYLSGYEVFIRLRNWFKAYYEYKGQKGSEASDLRLIFKNYKDGEFLIVELTEFELDRQASESFLYNYSLNFEVLGHYTFNKQTNQLIEFEQFINNIVDALDYTRGVFFRSQDILRQVESTYDAVVNEPIRKTVLTLKAAQGIPFVAADMGSKAIKSTVSAAKSLALLQWTRDTIKEQKNSSNQDPNFATVKLPKDIESAARENGAEIVASLGTGLLSMDPSLFPEQAIDMLNKDAADAQNLPRSFFEDAIQDINRVKQNLEDFLGLGDSDYDALFNRTTTLEADFGKVPTPAELEVLNAFNEALDSIQSMLAYNDFFKSSFDERIADMVNRFGGNLDLIAEGAVRQVRYQSGQTLERIAQFELGDSLRWGELVELNGLKAPYVSDDISENLDNVLKPGDFLLIPTKPTSGFSQTPQAKEIRTTKALSELERSLGSDLKLTESFDLALTNSGDFDVVSGADNMAQAVILTLHYEKGDLIRNPSKGVGLVPGVKYPALKDIYDSLVESLLSDPRIDRVEDVSIERDGPAAYIAFNIKVKSVDLPIPVKIKV